MTQKLNPSDCADPGIEWEVEEEDLEAAAKAGRPPRRAKRYRFRVDREYFTVDVKALTGREILTAAGKVPPDHYILSQKFRGGRAEKVGLDQKVDLTAEGVERFMSLPKDQQEG